MKIAVLKERRLGEKRVAISPEVAGKLIALGFDVSVETGLADPRATVGACWFDYNSDGFLDNPTSNAFNFFNRLSLLFTKI